jgi:hypothetical protein
MKTTSSEPQLQWPDKREDDRDNIAKSAVRKSGESERWQREICAIGCMYLEHVDGRWLRRHRYGGGAGQSKTKQQQQHFRPRRDRSRTPAGMPKGQGRRRKEGGIGTAMHAHAGWQGRLHTGKATYREGYILHRSAPARRARCVWPWDGRRHLQESQGCTPAVAYNFVARRRPRGSMVAAAMRARSACAHDYGSDGAAAQAKPCQRRANTRSPAVDWKASLVSCAALSALLALPWGPPEGLLSAGLRQHRRPSLAEARNGMPNFTWLAADAPWAVVGEALAVAAMIGTARRSLRGSSHLAISRGAAYLSRGRWCCWHWHCWKGVRERGCVKRVVAVGSPDVPQNL